MRNKNNISGYRYRIVFIRNSMIKTILFYLALLVQEYNLFAGGNKIQLLCILTLTIIQGD